MNLIREARLFLIAFLIIYSEHIRRLLFLDGSEVSMKRAQIVIWRTVSRREKLYEAVEEVWNDKNNLPALATAYLVHHQIIYAILDSEGGNGYLRERKSLSFRVRHANITTGVG